MRNGGEGGDGFVGRTALQEEGFHGTDQGTVSSHGMPADGPGVRKEGGGEMTVEDGRKLLCDVREHVVMPGGSGERGGVRAGRLRVCGGCARDATWKRRFFLPLYRTGNKDHRTSHHVGVPL